MVNSWLTYASCFGVAYSYGGGLVAIFSPILSAVTQWIMLQGVSELSSAFPSSGVSDFQNGSIKTADIRSQRDNTILHTSWLQTHTNPSLLMSLARSTSWLGGSILLRGRYTQPYPPLGSVSFCLRDFRERSGRSIYAISLSFSLLVRPTPLWTRRSLANAFQSSPYS